MADKKKIVNLLRPGASEHKRTDLFSSYYCAASLFCNELENVNWDEKDNIIDVFKKWDVLKKQKEEKNVNREKSLFKKLNLIEENEKIVPTKLAKEFIGGEIENYFFNMSKSEYDFFLIFLFDDYKNESQGFEILKRLYANKNIYFISNENLFVDINNPTKKELELIKKDILISSGSKYNTPYIFDGTEYKTKQEQKNLLIEKWFEISINKIKGENIIKESEEYFSLLKDMSKKNNSNIYAFSKETILPLMVDPKLDGDAKKNQLNKIKKAESSIDAFASSYQDLMERSINRVISGSIGSYKCLVNNHLRFIPIIGENEDGFYIKKDYKNLISSIIASKSKLIIEFEKSGYINAERFKKLLNIEDGNIPVIDNNRKIFEQYREIYKNLDNLIEILGLYDIENFDGDVKKMRTAIDSHIEKSKHVKGLCNASTYYEFVIGFSLLLKITDAFSLKPREFVELLRNSLNLKFSSENLTPYSHAPGGRPDINIRIDSGDIIAEPTIQLKDQTSMEGDSIKRHVNSYERKISDVYFVSPKIERDVVVTFEGWKDANIIKHKVTCWTTKELVEYLKTE